MRKPTFIGSEEVRLHLAADPALMLHRRPDGSFHFTRTFDPPPAEDGTIFVQTARPHADIVDPATLGPLADCTAATTACDDFDFDAYGAAAARCLAQGGTPPRCAEFEPEPANQD